MKSLLFPRLRDQSDAAMAAEKARYHKTQREVLGLSNAVINDEVSAFRRDHALPDCLAEARRLWATEVFEARIAAGKLLVKARIKPAALEQEVWEQIIAWVPELDGWAIADHLAGAGDRRLSADLTRLDTLEGWTTSDHLWTRRAAMTFTLPLAKLRHPSAEEAAARARVLGWAAAYCDDPEWFIQKSVSWWLRTLGDRDPAAARAFVAAHGDRMKAFARKDALRKIGGQSSA